MADDRLMGPFLTPEEIRRGFTLDEFPAGWQGPHRFHVPDTAQHPRSLIVHTDELAYEELLVDVERWEKFIPYMYLDIKGVVTVGIGNALFAVDSAKTLPFANTSTGQAATEAEIVSAFNTVTSMKIGKTPMQLKHTSARAYKIHPSLEITETFARELVIKRLKNEFVPQAKRVFWEFDWFPKPARRCIVDMTYNGGPGYFRKLGMRELLEQRRWLDALARLPTDGDLSRLAWRERLLRAAHMEETHAAVGNLG